MSQSRTLFIGMDGHNNTIAVASVAQDHGAEVTSLGPIGTRQGDIDQLVRTMPSKATHLIFVYEAGPCGSWLSRYVTHKGDDGWGVAPSLLPKKAGDRVTTDHRDAVPLARLARAGDLTAVSVPKVEDAALRDLSRARAETRSDLQAAKLRLKAFFLRHDIRSTGRTNWSPAPLRWLSAGVCPTPAPHIVLQAYVRAVNIHTERRQRLAQERQEQVQSWRLHPVVEALQALRGVQCTVAVTPVAVTPVAALGDLTRVENPRARMQCLGRIPRGICHGGAPPPGVDDPSRQHPCPSRSRCRRLGLSVPSASAPAAPTATGKATEHHPGHPREGPSQAVQALPKTARTRQTGQPGGRGHGS